MICPFAVVFFHSPCAVKSPNVDVIASAESSFVQLPRRPCTVTLVWQLSKRGTLVLTDTVMVFLAHG